MRADGAMELCIGFLKADKDFSGKLFSHHYWGVIGKAIDKSVNTLYNKITA